MKTFLEAYYDNYNPRVSEVPGWQVPHGMSDDPAAIGGVGTVDNPMDPDARGGQGKSLSDLTPGEMSAFRSEIEKYGGRMMLHATTAGALQRFERTPSWSANGYKKTGVRWALRPPVTNELAGGIDDSYHKSGEAIDVKHNGRPPSVEGMKQLISDLIRSGFRGIGFGGTQTHMDTRTSGVMIYTYPGSWNGPNPVSVVNQMLADVGSSERIKSMPSPNRSGLGTSNLSKKGMNDLRNWAYRDYPQATKRDAWKPTVQVDTRGINQEIKRTDWSLFSPNTATAAAIVAALVGGIFLARRFFRRGKNKELERILEIPGAKAKLIQIRNKYQPLLDKAKDDPDLRAKIERAIEIEIKSIR